MSNDPRIVIDKDSVTIEGIIVQRPQRMSRGQWLEWWDDERKMDPYDVCVSSIPAHSP